VAGDAEAVEEDVGVAEGERAAAEVECAAAADSLPRQVPHVRVALAPVPGQVLAPGQALVVVKELLPGPLGRRAVQKLLLVLQGPRLARKAEPDRAARARGKSPEPVSALAPREE
jgi:hypothetical protein